MIIYEAPSKMQKAGVKFSISTGDDGANVRDLPYQAGIAGAFGLGRDEALKAVTLYPAQILGIADKYELRSKSAKWQTVIRCRQRYF